MGDSAHRDEQEIRALIEAYSDAVNRRDEAAWAALWTPDGAWELFGPPVHGRDAIVAAWRAALERCALVFHVAHSAVLTVDGDAARGRWTVSERIVLRGGRAALVLALYHDEYRREAGRWRITSRRFEPLYQGPPDLSGTLPGA